VTEHESLASTPANAAAGRRLRASRVLLGLEQAALAVCLSEELGRAVTQQSVSAWERGARTVPAIVLEACEAWQTITEGRHP